MRCFLLRGGHIVAVKELSTDLSDEEAIEQCRLTFENSLQSFDNSQYFDDFEVWKRARKIYQHSLDQGLLASSSKRPLALNMAGGRRPVNGSSRCALDNLARLLCRARRRSGRWSELDCK